jgi:hypothetical protein
VQSVEFSSGNVEGVAFLEIFGSLVIHFRHFQFIDTGNSGVSWFAAPPTLLLCEAFAVQVA